MTPCQSFITKNAISCRRAFTLVELIVVITILVILGTIAFLSLWGYAAAARDSARIENLSNLHRGLSLFQVKSGSYPMPESPVNITASGTTIGYQGFAKDQIETLASLSKWGTINPADLSMYTTYSVNVSQNKMSLMAFLEEGSTLSLVPESYAATASDYSKRYPIIRGDTIGILLGNSGASLNQPIQEWYNPATFTGVDVRSYTGAVTAFFSQTNTLVNSWSSWVASNIAGVEFNYSGNMQLLTTSCPTGWINVGKGIGTGNNVLFSGASSVITVLCSVPVNTIIPSGTQLWMLVCPTTPDWSDTGLVKTTGVFVTASTSIQSHVCTSTTTTTIPSGSQVMMSVCPAYGWTDVSRMKIGSNFPRCAWLECHACQKW